MSRCVRVRTALGSGQTSPVVTKLLMISQVHLFPKMHVNIERLKLCWDYKLSTFSQNLAKKNLRWLIKNLVRWQTLNSQLTNCWDSTRDVEKSTFTIKDVRNCIFASSYKMTNSIDTLSKYKFLTTYKFFTLFHVLANIRWQILNNINIYIQTLSYFSFIFVMRFIMDWCISSLPV